MNLLRAHRTELVLFFLSLAVHAALFAYLVHINGNVVDTVRVDDGYFELAQNILAGNGFSWSAEPPYAPNPLRTPGYIYLLAGLIGVFGVTGAALVQMVLASAIPVLGMYIARSVADSRAIGIFAGVVLALDPTLALLSFQFYTDTVFLLLILPFFLLILRYFRTWDIRMLAVSALFLGVALLVRPVVQYIPFLLVPFILWHFRKNERRRGVIHSMVLLLIVGVLVTPWVLRNVQVFGSPGISAQTPFVLYTNLAPAVLSVANKTDFQNEVDTFLTPAEYKGDAITLANGRTYTEKALAVVREHPAATAFVAGKSLFTFFTNDGFYTLLARLGHVPWNFLPFLVVARLIWIAITIMALFGACVIFFTRRSPQTIFVLILVPYFALTSTIAAFGTNPRYRLPVDPIILALAASSTVYAITEARRRITRVASGKKTDILDV